ncbi:MULTISPECIES: MFS transporter [unclassified Novosphingobium]|uniref:MFS transporter n=1 Tax=unclassified Novosphingobium TaxID=2644732 RepID=UPI00190F4447|nr:MULTISPECIES: MFS transporter [unclassified Novosphingobium]
MGIEGGVVIAIIAAATPGEIGEPSRAAWTIPALFTVAFLGVTAGVQMSDRGLQSILLSPIQSSFDVGDATIGALQGLAGVLVASAIAVPIARLADRMSRKRVLIGLIAGWSALMVVSALAPNFPLFFIGRAASGVTEFAMIPIVYSMIPDLAPERYRVAANLSFAALMAAGAGAGYYFGDDIVRAGDAVFAFSAEPWRKAILLLSLAGAPLIVAALFTVDPRRLVISSDSPVSASLIAFLRERWRAVGLFVGVAGSLMIAVQALNPLIALALERRFGADMRVIGHALGIVTLLTSIGCLPVAGYLDQALRRRFGLAARPIIMGAGAFGAIPCAALLLTVGDIDVALVLVGLFLFLTCIANALVPTMLQDLTPVALRARSFAVWSFVVSIFCAVGPMVVGAVSDFYLGGQLLTAIAVTAIPALLLSAGCAVRSVR